MTDRQRPPSVMFLLDSLGAGGAERSTALLAMELRRLGVTVSFVLLYSTEQGSEHEVRNAGFPVHVLAARGFAQRALELRRLLHSERPDVLHTAIFAADQVGRVAAFGLSTKLVSSLINVPREPSLDPGSVAPWKTRLVNAADALTSHMFVDRFHAVTAGVAELYASAYRLKPQKITVVERGRPVLALGERTAERRERVRQLLGVRNDQPLIVAAGRHEQQKAHTELVSVLELLTPEWPEAVVTIAGRDGNASAALRDRIAASDAGSRVLLLGHREDVPDLLAAADVMALPSRFEGTAGIALEAMAIGTPIVSTELPGMNGILIDGVNALVVPVSDARAFAAAVSRILGDARLAESLGSNGRTSFLERFTMERSASKMLEFYRQVLEN